MSRFLWMAAFVVAVSTGCGDSPVGPVQGTYTSTLTFVEPTVPTEADTCPSSCAMRGELMRGRLQQLVLLPRVSLRQGRPA